MDWYWKALLTGASVAALLVVARWLGQRIAGALAGLPTVTGPALVWLALDRGTAYAAEAAIGSVAACALCSLFALAYDRASRYAGIGTALAIAVVAAALAAPPLQWLESGLALSLAIAAPASLLAYAAMPERSGHVAAVRVRGEVALTAIVSGAVSAVVALSAGTVAPFWAGVLASPPLIAAAVAMQQHRSADHSAVRRFLRGYVGGLLGRAVFGTGFALLLAPLGLAAATALASVAGCLSTAATMRLHVTRRKAGYLIGR